MEATLLVNSSSGAGSYLVNVIYDGSNVSLHCNCPAGKLGKFCKHKFGIISGEIAILADKNQLSELDKIQEWVKKTTISNLLNQLNDAETQFQKAQFNLRLIKKKLEKAMKDGA